MPIVGLDHVYLVVSDFERSESFYDRMMRALRFFLNEVLNEVRDLSRTPRARDTPGTPAAA